MTSAETQQLAPSTLTSAGALRSRPYHTPAAAFRSDETAKFEDSAAVLSLSSAALILTLQAAELYASSAETSAAAKSPTSTAAGAAGPDRMPETSPASRVDLTA